VSQVAWKVVRSLLVEGRFQQGWEGRTVGSDVSYQEMGLEGGWLCVGTLDRELFIKRSL
jgi:hypothetical protein